MGKWCVTEHFIMLVVGNYIPCPCGYGTIHKLIIVRVILDHLEISALSGNALNEAVRIEHYLHNSLFLLM